MSSNAAGMKIKKDESSMNDSTRNGSIIAASEGLTENFGLVVTSPMAPQQTCSCKPGYTASATLD